MRVCKICRGEFPDPMLVAVDQQYLMCESCASKYVKATSELPPAPEGTPEGIMPLVDHETWSRELDKYLDTLIGPVPEGHWRVAVQHLCGHLSVQQGPEGETQPPTEEMLKQFTKGRCMDCIMKGMEARVRQAEEIAARIASGFESACADLAMGRPWEGPMADEKVERWCSRVVANGCTDLVGAYADRLYDDPEWARDFMGDRLCDEAGSDDVLHDLVIGVLVKRFPNFLDHMVWDKLRRKKVSDE